MRIRLSGSAVLAAAVSAALMFSACGQTGRPAGAPHDAARNGGFTVGVLMPDNNVTRYRTFDTPLIEKRIKELCGACTVKSANAQGDASTQRQQINTMVTSGAKVLILNCADTKACRNLVRQARDAGVPVVAYDRLPEGPISGYVSHDDYAIGRLQAQALHNGMGDKAHGGQIVWLDLPLIRASSPLPIRPTGAMSVLRSSGVRIDADHVIMPPEDERLAYAAMSAAIASHGPHGIDGVYAENDVIAAGAIAALKAARVTPLPPVVGQDADLSAIQRILLGEQYMTVYKPYTPQADAAAEMAVALGRGRSLDGIARTTVSNSTTKDIPAVLLPSVPVTAKSITSTVVRDGVYTIEQICTPTLAAACRKAGLT